MCKKSEIKIWLIFNFCVCLWMNIYFGPMMGRFNVTVHLSHDSFHAHNWLLKFAKLFKSWYIQSNTCSRTINFTFAVGRIWGICLKFKLHVYTQQIIKEWKYSQNRETTKWMNSWNDKLQIYNCLSVKSSKRDKVKNKIRFINIYN